MEPLSSDDVKADSLKRSASDEEVEDDKWPKLKRAEIEIAAAESDIKLAEKLDKCLSLGDTHRPRFFMNKTRDNSSNGTPLGTGSEKLKARNLSKDELRERIIKRYDSLVPELDPKRPQVKLVKILSANESIDMGKIEAKKQLERQLELNSVAGNRHAVRNGIKTFKFHDGYEMPTHHFLDAKTRHLPSASDKPTKPILRHKVEENQKSKGKTIKFAEFTKDCPNSNEVDHHSSGSDDDDELTESDCSSGDN